MQRRSFVEAFEPAGVLPPGLTVDVGRTPPFKGVGNPDGASVERVPGAVARVRNTAMEVSPREGEEIAGFDYHPERRGVDDGLKESGHDIGRVDLCFPELNNVEVLAGVWHSHVEQFGENLGLAFQIVDDLLDCQGDWIKMGKMTGKDDQQGKLTFPNLIGIEPSQARADELVNAAIAAIDCFESRAEPLKSLARYVLERNR